MSSVSFLSFFSSVCFCLFPLRLGSWNWILYCSSERSCRHSMFYHMKNIVKFILNNQKSLLLKNLFVLCPFPFLIKTEMKAWNAHTTRGRKRGATRKGVHMVFLQLNRFNMDMRMCICSYIKRTNEKKYQKVPFPLTIFDSFSVWFFYYFFFLARCVLVIGIVFKTISKLNRQPLNWIRHLIHARILRHDFPQTEFNIHTWNAMSERM